MTQDATTPPRMATSLERTLIFSDLCTKYPDLPWSEVFSKIRSQLITDRLDQEAAPELVRAEILLRDSLGRYNRRLFDSDDTSGAAVSSRVDGASLRVGNMPPSRRIDAFAQAVVKENSEDYDAAVTAGLIAPDDDSVAIIKWPTAQAEVEGAARLVHRFLAADESMLPQDIYLMVFDKTTAEVLQDELNHYRIEGTVALDDDPLSGDPRKPTATMEAWARLALAADKDDLLTWRVWCALGRRGLSTKPWLSFTRWAAGQGLEDINALEGLLEVSGEPFEGAALLIEAIVRGKSFAATSSQLKGFSLVKACNPKDDQEFMRLVGHIEGHETPQDLLDRVNARARWQVFEETPHAVRIGSPRHCLALAPRLLVTIGTVEGACPCARVFDEQLSENRRKALEARDRALFAAAVACAKEQLIVSMFQALSEGEARARGYAVVRKIAPSGEPLVRVRPSRFIAEAQNAAPGTQSAEQYEMMI